MKAVTDWSKQGKTKYKETAVEETSSFTILGWENIYRGYKESEWPEIFLGERSEYNPISNLGFLKDKNVYISHGKLDKSVNWHKSYKFYQALKSAYPQNSIYWKLLNGGHSNDTTAQGLDFMLNEINTNHY